MEISTKDLINALRSLAATDAVLNEAALRLETLEQELEDARQLNRDTFESFYGQN